MDLEYTGQRLTWNISQVGDGRVERKLDQALMNARWKEVVEFSKAQFDVPLLSDHSPTVVVISDLPRKKGFPFRYKNFWGEEPNYDRVVQGVWGDL